ncbi:protein kinase [Streptomyces sioyaensis]|uniref:serine/threonine-protein kinase n=1 Tax=Streptomyces sioyaensis TaxID=67364 RepID=UPI00379A0DF7
MRGELFADRYRLLAVLGSGGTGQVWRARDEVLGREVAVKVVPTPAGADATTGERFLCEARAAARLSHPGIVKVFDAGHASDGRLFLVMELVEGRSLAQVLRQDRLPAEQVADIGAQVAHALAAAHDGGVVHRDVKPANLLIQSDGTVKVVDFGLAVLAEENSTALTTTGAFIGTAFYTAPERAMGQRGTAACDLYALGCVLYEALSGRPPFRTGNAVELLFQHVHRQPDPLHRLRPDIPPALARVVHALLAKEPADRPADAARTARLLSVPESEDAGRSPAPLEDTIEANLPAWPARPRRLLHIALGMVAACAVAGTFALAWPRSPVEPTGDTSAVASPAPDSPASRKPPASPLPSASSTTAAVRATTPPTATFTSATPHPCQVRRPHARTRVSDVHQAARTGACRPAPNRRTHPHAPGRRGTGGHGHGR